MAAQEPMGVHIHKCKTIHHDKCLEARVQSNDVQEQVTSTAIAVNYIHKDKWLQPPKPTSKKSLQLRVPKDEKQHQRKKQFQQLLENYPGTSYV